MMKIRILTSVATVPALVVLGTWVDAFAQNLQPSSASQTDPLAQVKILNQYGKLPLSFEANQGHTDARVRFLSRTSGYTLFLTGDEAVLVLRGNKTGAKSKIVGTGHTLRSSRGELKSCGVLRMKLLHANSAAKVTGADELPGKVNYFIGNDPKKWKTNVSTYTRVKYESVYPGVDLVYYGNQQQLEYDFVVSPGADPSSIAFKLEGSQKMSVDAEGDLALGINGDAVQFRKPLIYQEAGGIRRKIAGNYVRRGTDQVGFQLGDYDPSKPLVIDPVLVYSTYLTSNGSGWGNGVAVDSSAHAYVTGSTEIADFPTTAGAFQSTASGVPDAFVTKFNSSGSALVYSTYLGGSFGDLGQAIAIDSSGNAYVAGFTQSADFPTTAGAFQTTFSGKSNSNGFVVKLNSSGSALVYSTYLADGGGFSDSGIAVDSSGNAYITGSASSSSFPTTAGAFQTTFSGYTKAFVTKLNSNGSALVYSTLLGGTGNESGEKIAVDSSGQAYVTGRTDSIDFPITQGVGQTYILGAEDAYVAKFNSSGSGLIYSTYLGPGLGIGIAIDSSGNAYVTGVTSSANFPTTSGASQTIYSGGSYDVFVSKLNNIASALFYSTYLGGTGRDEVGGIAVDFSGNTWVTGFTDSTDFPTTAGAFQTTYGGGSDDAFVTVFNGTGSVVYSTYLGSNGEDGGQAIAVDSSGNAFVTGGAASNFPTTTAAFQPTSAGGIAPFVTKISSVGSGNTPPTTTANPSSGPNIYGWNNTNVTVALNSTDNPGSPGVKEIEFFLSGAENLDLQTVAGNTASVTISAQGITILTYFATDNAGNTETAKTLTVQIDETSPVMTVTGVSNGALYSHSQVPTAGCTTTDTLSGVATPASLVVKGGNRFGYGNYTATCSGAMDKAGNLAAPVSVSYTVNARRN